MTEGKKIGQWIVGMVLLFLFLVTAFIPWITLSGNDYVDAAVNVHEYARNLQQMPPVHLRLFQIIKKIVN